MDVQLIQLTNDALNQYYDAEKNALPVVISAGVFLCAMGVALLKQNAPLSRGVGAAMVGAALLVAGGAIVYGFQVGTQKAIYAGLLSNDAPNYCTQELAHLNRMQDNFKKIIGTDLIIAVLGLGLFALGLSIRHEFMRGFGLGLGGMFLLLSFLENHNRLRALRYREKVETLQKHLAFEG